MDRRLLKLTNIPIDSAVVDTPFYITYDMTEPQMIFCNARFSAIYYCKNILKYYLCRILLTVLKLSMKNRTLFNACGYYLHKVLREAKNLKEARKMKGDKK